MLSSVSRRIINEVVHGRILRDNTWKLYKVRFIMNGTRIHVSELVYVIRLQHATTSPTGEMRGWPVN
jgi:hypothetical protein